MTMQTDVKSTHTSGTQTNLELVAGRTRLKSVIITGASGGAQFLDASGGNVLFEVTTSVTASVTNLLLPGEGILFTNGIWYTSVATAPTGITVCYG